MSKQMIKNARCWLNINNIALSAL